MAEGEHPTAQSATSDSKLLGSVEGFSRQSPPKVTVDTSPLQPQMDKNKESLKKKLMLRRTATQLADQGIYPSLTTSPALHEQKKQLERAKTGDLLKAKIQQRPNRQELERRHILEHEESFVDPSLAEKQRMLKKARLADQLNSQISHRPGPLELIKKNILHTEEPIERIVKEGLVTFKATSEGFINRPQHPNSYITFEDDSQSSESDFRSSPVRTASDVLEAAAASAGIVVTIPTSGGPVVVTPVIQTKFHPGLISTSYVPPPPPPPPPPPLINTGTTIKTESIPIKTETQDTSTLFAELCKSVVGAVNCNSQQLPNHAASPSSLGSTTSTLSPVSSIASPQESSSQPSRVIASPHSNLNQQKTDAPGKDKNRKKLKTKPVAKTRTIKFHEYKGPPNAQKQNNSSNYSSSNNSQTEETCYQLCLKQQNFLMEYLEGYYNKQKTILPKNQNEFSSQPSPTPSSISSIPPSPAPSFSQESFSNNTSNSNNNNNNSNCSNNNSNVSNNNNCSSNNNNISAIELNKLEKMKVSDLKSQLRKLNLPVSGPKPQLIERLKPFLPFDDTSESNSGETTFDIDPPFNSPKNSLSPESEHDSVMMDYQQDSPLSTYTAGRQTPLLINEDLVREQKRQIDELQRQLKEKQEELQQMKNQQQLNSLNIDKQQESINQKLIIKQQLEAKIHKEKLNQLENLQKQTKDHLNKQQQRQKAIYIEAQMLPRSTTSSTSSSSVASSLKEENNLESLWQDPQLVLVDFNNENNKKLLNGHHRTSSMPANILQIQTQQQQQQQQQQQPPPPKYEEATKQLKREIHIKTERHPCSQDVSDVLEILVDGGCLPPESVLYPTTPTTDDGINLEQDMIFETSTGLHGNENNYSDLSTMLEAPNVLTGLECMSPMQADHHTILDDNSSKGLDMLLGETSVVNGVSMSINKTSNNRNVNDENHAIKESLNDFNNWPTLELIKQQLEMDMGEDCSQFNSTPNGLIITQNNNNNNISDSHTHNSNNNNNNNNNSNNNNNIICNNNISHNINSNNNNNNNNSNNNTNSNNNNKRRDMNPSLQPSLNELISSSNDLYKNNNNSCYDYNFSNNSNNNNNNFNGETAMDVDFINSLNSFDFCTLGTPSNVQCDNDSLLHSNNSSIQHSHQIDTPPHTFTNGLDGGQEHLNHNTNHQDIFDLNFDDLRMNCDQMSWETDFPLMNCH